MGLEDLRRRLDVAAEARAEIHAVSGDMHQSDLNQTNNRGKAQAWSLRQVPLDLG